MDNSIGKTATLRIKLRREDERRRESLKALTDISLDEMTCR